MKKKKKKRKNSNGFFFLFFLQLLRLVRLGISNQAILETLHGITEQKDSEHY